MLQPPLSGPDDLATVAVTLTRRELAALNAMHERCRVFTVKDQTPPEVVAMMDAAESAQQKINAAFSALGFWR